MERCSRAAGVGIRIGRRARGNARDFLRTLLFGVTPFDPMSFVGVAVVLSGIVLIASYIPARRAMRVDPAEALRHD